MAVAAVFLLRRLHTQQLHGVLAQPDNAAAQLFDCVARELRDVGVAAAEEVKAGCSKDAGGEPGAVEVQRGKVEELGHQAERLLVVQRLCAEVLVALGGDGALEVEFEPHDGRGGQEVPVDGLEDGGLKLQDLLGFAGAVCEVGKLRQRWGVDFLDLGGNEETGDADELEAALGHVDAGREEAVDVVEGHVVGLAVHVELFADLDEPVEEEGAHAGLDGRVVLQAVEAGEVLGLLGDHGGEELGNLRQVGEERGCGGALRAVELLGRSEVDLAAVGARRCGVGDGIGVGGGGGGCGRGGGGDRGSGRVGRAHHEA
eukprot:m.92716 g.92716  ORF g.92716 m.92716 type:complete len:315 (-) comp15342_c1_seq1:662-1606(-)